MVAREHGSVLVLLPAAALVSIVLGALAVDATVLFLAERELAGAAAAAANDAATRAIDRDAFYDEGVVVLDAVLAADVAWRSVAAKQLEADGFEVAPPEVVVGAGVVTVTLRGRAPYLFSKALPGVADDAPVSATASATATSPP